MDQLNCASLPHSHYWHEVGMLKVPATGMSYRIVFRDKLQVRQTRARVGLKNGQMSENWPEEKMTTRTPYRACSPPPNRPHESIGYHGVSKLRAITPPNLLPSICAHSEFQMLEAVEVCGGALYARPLKVKLGAR